VHRSAIAHVTRHLCCNVAAPALSKPPSSSLFPPSPRAWRQSAIKSLRSTASIPSRSHAGDVESQFNLPRFKKHRAAAHVSVGCRAANTMSKRNEARAAGIMYTYVLNATMNRILRCAQRAVEKARRLSAEGKKAKGKRQNEIIE
jgi:hypothetical protein